jgi:hypothetical protein
MKLSSDSALPVDDEFHNHAVSASEPSNALSGVGAVMPKWVLPFKSAFLDVSVC